MNLNVCKDFQIRQTPIGLVIVTPFVYEDMDQIVIFADRQDNGHWHIHDNGDAALRLMFDGVDPYAPKIQSWLKATVSEVEWNDEDNALERCNVNEADIVPAALKVAQACIQLQAMSSHRVSREESTFKAEVVSVLKEISKETDVAAQFDVPIDQKRLFVSDCLFLSKTPLAIFIASSKERLLEAELAWSNLRRTKDPTRVIAVIEEQRTTGIKEVTRAQYFTDKTLQYREFESVFREAVKDSIQLQ